SGWAPPGERGSRHARWSMRCPSTDCSTGPIEGDGDGRHAGHPALSSGDAMRHGLCALAIAFSLAADPVDAQDKPPSAAATIETGSTVELEYTLKDDGGAVIDTNKGKDPLRYTHGERQIIPGLERELTGMHPGDEKKVVVKPEDGYGSVNPDATAEVPKASIPPNALVVGTRLLARSQSGETRPVMVKQINENTVTLDLNHPLAGKTRFFDVKVIGVSPPGDKPTAPAPSAKPAN